MSLQHERPPPKVSVFMASYNGAPYVDTAIQSVRDQTLGDVELVIVDDGSGQETLDILRRHATADPRITLVEGAHRGQIATLNHALSLCRAPYVARLDHDDVALPKRLELQSRYLDTNPAIVAIGSATGRIDAAGTLHGAKRTSTKRLRNDPTAFPPRIVFLMGPTLMARATAIRAAGGFREQFRAAEDRDISWRLAAIGPTAHLPEVTVHHRTHSSNLSVKENTTQANSHLLCDLSAIAARLGRNDETILATISAGAKTDNAFAAYSDLIGNDYPARALVLLHRCKKGWLRGRDATELRDLATSLVMEIRRKPLSRAALYLAPRWVRVTTERRRLERRLKETIAPPE